MAQLKMTNLKPEKQEKGKTMSNINWNNLNYNYSQVFSTLVLEFL